jgi:hypothetical protein
VKLWGETRRARSRSRDLVFYLGGTAGAGLGLFGRAWPLPTLASAVGIGVAATAILGLLTDLSFRWVWAWQEAFVWLGRRDERELSRIVGARMGRGAAEAWLARSAAAPAYERCLVLSWVGRDDEAERLIPEFPMSTAKERFRGAFREAVARWRSTGHLDLTRAHEAAAELEVGDRRSAQVSLAFWNGVAGVASWAELRSMPAPVMKGLRLAPSEWDIAFWIGLWPAIWFAGVFALTWICLSVLSLVIQAW